MRKIKMLTLGLVLAAIMGVNGFLAKTNSASASMELNIDNIERIAEGEPNGGGKNIWVLIKVGAKFVWKALAIYGTIETAGEIYDMVTTNEGQDISSSNFDGSIVVTVKYGQNIKIQRIECSRPEEGDKPNCNRSTFKTEERPIS